MRGWARASPPEKALKAEPLEAYAGLNVFFVRQITDSPYVPKILVHIAAQKHAHVNINIQALQQEPKD
jgi:hypothetical protein